MVGFNMNPLYLATIKMALFDMYSLA